MARILVEKSKTLPKVKSYDVVVVGGGIAGIAAAVSAARNGARVCLLEKMFGLGGLATLGNVVIYLPLCDGMGRQVIGGLGEELLKLSVRQRPEEIPSCWRKGGHQADRTKKRYAVRFNPQEYLLDMETFLIKNGVEIWYDTRFCDLIQSAQRIEALIVENKSGRLAIPCKTVIDASGDADVCARAGEPTVSLKTNVRSGWFYYFDGSTVHLNAFSRPFDPLGRKMPRDDYAYAGDDGRDVSEQVIETRKLIQNELTKIRKKNPGKINEPVLLASIPCFRMTRRLKGNLELNETDDHRWFDDSVGMTGDWRKNGPIYYLPLRTLVAVKTKNLITAGRCISANTAWDVTRVIPTCAVTGEAAGTAAAIAAKECRSDLSRLNISDLQKQLKKQEVYIDPTLATK